jgi:hypothetical protein
VQQGLVALYIFIPRICGGAGVVVLPQELLPCSEKLQTGTLRFVSVWVSLTCLDIFVLTAV